MSEPRPATRIARQGARPKQDMTSNGRDIEHEEAQAVNHEQKLEPQSETKSEIARCQLTVIFDEKGNAYITKAQGPCGETFKNLPPIKQSFWLRRMTENLRRQIEEPQTKE
mgnify:CR=1 FL=1